METIRFHVVLEKKDYEAVRTLAFERHVKMAVVLREAVKQYLKGVKK